MRHGRWNGKELFGNRTYVCGGDGSAGSGGVVGGGGSGGVVVQYTCLSCGLVVVG